MSSESEMKTILLVGGLNLFYNPKILENGLKIVEKIVRESKPTTVVILSTKSVTATLRNKIHLTDSTVEVVYPQFGEMHMAKRGASAAVAEVMANPLIKEVHVLMSLIGDRREALSLYAAFFGKIHGKKVYIYFIWTDNYVVYESGI